MAATAPLYALESPNSTVVSASATMKRRRTEQEGISPSSGTPHVSPSIDGGTGLRLAKISRKIHACTECQARKIKCDVDTCGHSSCTRCTKKGMRCVVNKSLQSILDEGTGWRSGIEDDAQNLKSAVSKILSVLELPPLESFSAKQPAQETSLEEDHSAARSRPPRLLGMAMTRENSQEPDVNRFHDAIVTAPMGTLYEVTKLRNLRSNPHGHVYPPRPPTPEEDFITKGKISEAEAEDLFQTFSKSLNHYLWGGIALVHDNLASVRKSSSLLLAAILTVTALHIPGKEQVFDTCYSEFTALVCDSMFDRYHTLDGIRGLCIGAFWLSDVSWKLSGHAVRIATELNLHQSYSRAMRGSGQHIEGARLWYFLYVCDHHFSIAYGRPPVIHEDGTITHHEKFLDLPGTTQADLRLHSQVAVFLILTRVYNTFGPDIEQLLAEDDLVHLRHFNVALDTWRLKWESQLAPNPYILSYPAKGVSLHYHFSKLQVNSLCLRGIQQGVIHDLTADRRELASIAIGCATSILKMVLDEPDIRNSVIGVPIYLHTMITYSVVFLLKVQQKWKDFKLGTDPELIRELVTRTIKLLMDARAGERHLSSHISAGLSKMLDRFTSWEAHEQQEIISTEVLEQAHQGSQAPPQTWGPNYGMNPETGLLRTFDNSMPFYDEHFFPLGFFDVISPAQPNTEYRHRM